MDYQAETNASVTNWTAKWSVRLHRWKALLRKRWWILLLTIAICVAYQAWSVSRKPVLYQSFGKMILGGRLDNIQGGASYSEDLMNFYGTQIELMTSDEVVGRARRRLQIEFPDLQGGASIIASQVPRTATFNLVGTGSNPDYTQKFVNAVMEEFIAYKRDMRQEQTDTTMVKISEELARLRKELDEREAALNEFIEKNNMAFWEEQSNTAARFLSDLKTQQADLLKEQRLLENLSADQLIVSGGSVALTPGGTSHAGGEVNPSDGSAGASNQSYFQRDTAASGISAPLQAQYLQKRQELFQLQATIDSFARNLKPKHPKMVSLKEDAANLERLLGLIRDQIDDSTEARTATIKAELQSIETSITSWEEKVLEASKKGAEYKRLEDSLNRTRSLYEELLTSIQNLDISKNINQETIQVMQSASPAIEMPPNVLKHLLLGFMMGFGAGFGLLLLLDRADDRITSFTEVNEHFTLPILGQIPDVSEEESLQDGDVPLLKADDQRYMYAEAFRNLRSSLIFMPDLSDLKTLLVTSSIPGEGKSTIAANLAITMAFAGTRTLLVDADLKRGDLAKMFNIDGRFGFSTVLRDDTSWQSIALKTHYDNLTLLPRGPVASNPAELLLQSSLEAFMMDVREAYDLVIFNSAPILATDDTTTLAPSVDGALMVIRAFVTSKRLAENSLNALYQRQAKILGLVLNSVSTEVSDYYHYRYSQYYSKK